MALYNGLEESVPALAHFSPRLSPRLAASPLLSKDRNRRSSTREKTHDEDRWVGTGAPGDGEDGDRQGG